MMLLVLSRKKWLSLYLNLFKKSNHSVITFSLTTSKDN